MEVRDIFELRRQGRIEEAYEAVRPMYAVHKGKYTTLCMFWTANDILKKRLLEDKHEEAVKIFKALMHVTPNITDDKDGRIHATMIYDALRLSEEVPSFLILDFLEWYGVEQLTADDWKNPPQPCLAHRLLDRAFAEIREQPTVDNALKAMPLLTEALHRNPEDKQGRMYQDMVKDIIAKAEKAEEAQQPPTLRENMPHQPTPRRVTPSISHNDFGHWGEEVAAVYLEGKGYRILERDWHSGHRDIDIIARNSDSIVFVEVKTRRTHDFGEPYEAITYKKRQNLRTAINHYVRCKCIDLNIRFDIISIVAQDMSNPEIRHMEDVFLI